MNKWMVGRVARYVMEWRTTDFDSHPVVLNLPVTDNCNARCVMCDVWKNPAESDFTPTELRHWICGNLLNDICHVGISGGEPTLRKDLTQIFRILCTELPRLRSISVTTHGFHPKRWLWMAPQLRDIAADQGVPFRVNVSVDGVGPVHEEVRRIPGGFVKVEETLGVLENAGIPIQLQCTVSRPNVYYVTETLEYALRKELEIIFRVATDIARLENLVSMPKVALSSDEKSFFADFLLSEKLMSATQNPARRLFYRDLANRLETGHPRRAPCSFQRRGVMISATGEVYQCSIAHESMGSLREEDDFEWAGEDTISARKGFVKTTCSSCFHDQSGHWSPIALIAEVVRRSPVGPWLSRLSRLVSTLQLGLKLKPNRTSSTSSSRKEENNRRALLIGAYGGEHVGDAAILAGVCHRLWRREGVNDFTVLSFRPGRTGRWLRSVRMPDGCVARVISFEELSTDDFGDLVCYAGGPLMDLPLRNFRAWLIMRQAKKMGARITLEGVGIGPFRRRLGVASVKLLLRAANYMSVRTSIDYMSASGLGRIPDCVSDDPAEDYIHSGIWENSATQEELSDVQDIFSRSDQDNRFVAWNLRPLSWVYAEADTQLDLVQQAVRRHVAGAIRALPDFQHIFFPMNADQYGGSDLDEARRIRDEIQGDCVRVLARELGVGAVLEFLSRADAVIAMRFHACVFGAALGRPIVAIDYGIGRDQKVTKFMRRIDQTDACCRVDLLTTEWLTNQILNAVDRSRDFRI